MSDNEALRRQTEEQLRNYPQTPKVTEYQVPNYLQREVINSHMDFVRLQEEQRRRDANRR